MNSSNRCVKKQKYTITQTKFIVTGSQDKLDQEQKPFVSISQKSNNECDHFTKKIRAYNHRFLKNYDTTCED